MSSNRRNLFEFLSNQTQIRLYLLFFNWYGTKRTSVWFHLKILFCSNSTTFRTDFSVCKRYILYLWNINPEIYLKSIIYSLSAHPAPTPILSSSTCQYCSATPVSTVHTERRDRQTHSTNVLWRVSTVRYIRRGRPTFRPIHFGPTCFRPILT